MRKYFLNKRGTNNKLRGPYSPVDGLACLRVEGSGHLSVYRGHREPSTVGAPRKTSPERKLFERMFTHTNTHNTAHTAFTSLASLNESSGRDCAALISLIVSLLQFLASSFLPLGLYN